MRPFPLASNNKSNGKCCWCIALLLLLLLLILHAIYNICAVLCVCSWQPQLHGPFSPTEFDKGISFVSEKCNSIAAARSARCFERWIMLLTQSTFTIHQYGEMEMQRMPIYIARCIGIFTREMKCTLHARLQSLFNRTMQIFNILWHFTPTRLTFLVKRKLTIANRTRASLYLSWNISRLQG